MKLLLLIQLSNKKRMQQDSEISTSTMQLPQQHKVSNSKLHGLMIYAPFSESQKRAAEAWQSDVN